MRAAVSSPTLTSAPLHARVVGGPKWVTAAPTKQSPAAAPAAQRDGSADDDPAAGGVGASAAGRGSGTRGV